jgi:hypothetical protein
MLQVEHRSIAWFSRKNLRCVSDGSLVWRNENVVAKVASPFAFMVASPAVPEKA